MLNKTPPRDILMKLLEGLSNQNWNALVELYAEDVIIEWPLAIPAPVVIRGRESLQKALEVGWKILELKASNIRVYETDDPEIVIAEYDYNGKARATGSVFRSANILVLTVRNNEIVHARGYHNHVVAAAASDTLEQIIPLIELNPLKPILKPAIS